MISWKDGWAHGQSGQTGRFSKNIGCHHATKRLAGGSSLADNDGAASDFSLLVDGKNSTVNDMMEMLRKWNFKKPMRMLCGQSILKTTGRNHWRRFTKFIIKIVFTISHPHIRMCRRGGFFCTNAISLKFCRRCIMTLYIKKNPPVIVWKCKV